MILAVFVLLLCREVSSQKCIPRPKPEEAFEVLNLLNCTVYVADNRKNQITREAYRNWSPSNLWIRNPGGIRYLTFDDSCLFGSPGRSLHRHRITASEPWDQQVEWVYLANGCAGENGLGGCFPESCKYLLPKDGSLKWSEISKCHHMKWHANKTVSILSSPLGDQFILHATPDFETASLGKISGSPSYPPGWSVTTEILTEEFLLTPEPDDISLPAIPNGRVPFGKFSCGYVIVMDSAGNSFHRFRNASGVPESFRRNLLGELVLFALFKPTLFCFILFGVVVTLVFFLRSFFKRLRNTGYGRPAVKSD